MDVIVMTGDDELTHDDQGSHTQCHGQGEQVVARFPPPGVKGWVPNLLNLMRHRNHLF